MALDEVLGAWREGRADVVQEAKGASARQGRRTDRVAGWAVS
jgi:hypothetical protein